MFPISDVNGRVVGFTGRILEGDEKEAKYINTPQTLIYDKSRILYGLEHSRGEIRKKDKCLLVEGNIDVVMSHQAGVTNVVASSGTALTPMHLALLKRYTDNLDFCFDTDSAGAMATKRGIGMALGQNFSVRAVSIDDKDCKDPADYVKKYGNAWEAVVSSAKPVMEFYFEKAKENYKPESAESKKNVILTVAPFIKRISSKVEREHWINKMAYLLRVKEEAIEADIMSAQDDLNAYSSVESRQPLVSDKKPQLPVERDILNETLLSVVLKKPALFKEEIATLDKSFLNPLATQVFGELAKENF